MNELIKDLTQELRRDYPNITFVRPVFKDPGVCQYSGVKDNLLSTPTLFNYVIKCGFFVHSSAYKEMVGYSQTLDLVKNLALPSSWGYGIKFACGDSTYHLEQIRLSKHRWPGRVVYTIFNGQRIQNLRWSDLNLEERETLRNAVRDSQWPIGYPKRLRQYFAELKDAD